MLLHCDSLDLVGKVRVKLSQNLRDVRLSFLQPPDVQCRLECSVSVATLPIPRLELLSIFEDRVKSEFLKYLDKEMVHPNEFVHVEPPPRHETGTLSTADIQFAAEAARAARQRAEDDDPVC